MGVLHGILRKSHYGSFGEYRSGCWEIAVALSPAKEMRETELQQVAWLDFNRAVREFEEAVEEFEANGT